MLWLVYYCQCGLEMIYWSGRPIGETQNEHFVIQRIRKKT